jgi:hypothetical protein
MLGESVPLMKNIWGFDRDKALDEDLKARETIQRALDTKQMELDSFILSPRSAGISTGT